ncbi:WD40 repeat-containing protein [Thalassoporum mexicanum PCC 7367]|uniref:WD40 repeat domain-containing protein n=1 Tax=Thalassoporum mexicanum TaxID=3457544 RepID=UPI00029F95E9|nr:WD40 repeat domain-containing protein [Pseudanabaena sp. PCC 7367]AFY70333.1 WD40 repeat-containing protein [Pseudanabaena sp. PCC 7367]
MAASLNQPNEFDAALGKSDGLSQVEFDAPVLGGLAGLRQQIFNPHLAIATRVEALSKAMAYGEAGLDLVVEILGDRRVAFSNQQDNQYPQSIHQELSHGESLRRATYDLLKPRSEAKIRQLILAYNPYRFFNCSQVLAPAESLEQGQRSPIIAVIFAANQPQLITGSNNGWLRIWDHHSFQPLQSPCCIRSWRSDHAKLTAIAFDQNEQFANHLVATGTDQGSIRVGHLDRGNEIVCLIGHRDRIAALAFARNYLISSSRDGLALVWDWRSQQVVYELTGHGYPVAAVATGIKGNLAATGSRDAVKVWDLRTGQIVRSLGGNYPIAALTFSPDENFLIVAGKDKTIKVWDIWRKQLVRTLKGHNSTVDCLAISKDGLILVSAGRDRTIKIWDWRSGRLLRNLGDDLLEQNRHGADIEAVAISNDGGAIASASRDGTVRLWGMPGLV